MFPAAVADPVTAGLLHSVVGAVGLVVASVAPAEAFPAAAAALVVLGSPCQAAASRSPPVVAPGAAAAVLAP